MIRLWPMPISPSASGPASDDGSVPSWRLTWRPADELHADDYQLITPGALALSKSDYLGGIAAGALRYDRFEPDGDIAVRTWDTAAALRYQVEIVVVHDGATYRDRCWHTDIWELRDGRWVAVWSHATRIRSY